MSQTYTVKITEQPALDCYQNKIIHRKISLFNGDECIFENQPVFVAHRRMYMLGLATLAKQNLI